MNFICRAFGHEFEPRYSKSASPGLSMDGIRRCSEAFAENMAEKTRAVTYECDICRRCGLVVNLQEAKP